MLNSNLASSFFGPTAPRENRELYALWRSVEDEWNASGFGEVEPRRLTEYVVERALKPRGPLSPGLVETLFAVVEDLLAWESVGSLEVDWDAVRTDALAARRVRRLLERRRRWLRDPQALCDAMARALGEALATILDNVPARGDEETAPFDLTLIECAPNAAAAVERFMRAPYDARCLDLGLFERMKEILERNLARASGLPPGADLREHAKTLVMPAAQRRQDPAELAALYLADTPFERLISLPVPFSVPVAARFEHGHIVGGTGHGKTQLLQRLIFDDLMAAQKERRAVVVIDSQGDLIGKLRRLELFAPDAANSLADRLVVIDPADVEHPASLNLFDVQMDRLAAYRPVDQERVLNGVVELYETFFGDLLGAELTQKQGVIFKYLARLMLKIPGATVHTLMQLMENPKPYQRYMNELEGSARHFFAREFFDSSFAATKKQILKRLWGVLSTPAFERMFSQRSNKLDLFQALQDGKIILVSTAKDLLKQEGSQLFGRFFIALITQAALERSTVPEAERTPAMVYVDEAQEYFDDNIETILNQARKYRVGLTLAHQTLDQLTPRLRSILNANTSLKCVGGVSAKDARALAEDLRTDADFIESMRRWPDRTEFAVWLKNRTAHALRLSVPLGFLERQPTLTEEAFEQLQSENRRRYCGTLDEARFETFAPAVDCPVETSGEPDIILDAPTRRAHAEPSSRSRETPSPSPKPRPAPVEPKAFGKGGQRHRYLQALVKELGEQQGFRATIEAPLRDAAGQVDVLLEHKTLSIAFEISVSTPVEQERENVRKCLGAGYTRVALVLAKTKRSQERYKTSITNGLSDAERQRVAILAPEDVPDFIAALVAPADEGETVVKGYRVKVSRTTLSPEEAKVRRDQIARLIARSKGQK